MHIQKTGQVFDDLAEQYLVDCAYGYESSDGFDAQGCAGAWPQAYLEYLVKESKGQHQMESNYSLTIFRIITTLHVYCHNSYNYHSANFA